MADKRFFLLDAYALIFRGYYALIKNPIINSKGINTSAILTFTNFLLDLILKERPTHIAVVFDVGPSIRKKEYPQYKANRKETPDAIRISIPYIHDILKAFNIPILWAEGYEADDVIGTLVQKAQDNAYITYIVTFDKDFAQLVTDNIKIYKPASRGNSVEIIGVHEVCQRFEVHNPRQVIDILGMMGDAADNIPGLPGIGEKTAKKFIKKYGNLENLLAHSKELSGKIREQIEENKELGLISKKLATIITNVPIEWDEQKLLISIPDMNNVKRIFENLEFIKLLDKVYSIFFKGFLSKINRFSLKESLMGQQTLIFDHIPKKQVYYPNQIDNLTPIYQLIDTQTAYKILSKELLKQKTVVFNIETTTGFDAFNRDIIGIAFSYEKGTSYYMSFLENFDQTFGILKIFNPFFEDGRILKVGYNLEYNLKVLSKYGLFPKGPFYDIIIAYCLINPNISYSINKLYVNFLKYKKDLFLEKFICEGNGYQLSILDAELTLETKPDIILQIKDILDSKLASYRLKEFFHKMEMPLMSILATMGIKGFYLNKSVLISISKELEKDLKSIEQKIYQIADEIFNINSSRQLGKILFEKLKIANQFKKTKTRQYTLSDDILTKIVHEHIIINDILEYRTLQKLKYTFINVFSKKINDKSGRNSH